MHPLRRVVTCLALACLAGGQHVTVAAEPALFSDEWFRDKDLVSTSYVRDSWEDPKALAAALKGFESADFIAGGVGENGGRTQNLAGCICRVGPVTVGKLQAFHARVTSLGFRLAEGSPTVLAYKITPTDKAKADRLVSEARKRITDRLPDLVPGLQRSRTKDGTDTYHYPHQGFLCFAFDDLSSKMSWEMRGCGTAMAIHLPSLGYMIQVFGAKEQERGTASFVGPQILQLVKAEVSELVRLDSRARITYPQGDLHQPAEALPPSAER